MDLFRKTLKQCNRQSEMVQRFLRTVNEQFIDRYCI